MKLHWYFDSRILKLPLCVDHPAPVWLEQGWGILKLLLHVDESVSGATRAGLSILRGWGSLFSEADLEEVFGVLNCFPGVLVLDSGMVNPRDDFGSSLTITLSAVGVARTTVWGPVQTGWSGSFLQSLTHTSSPGWWEWTQFPSGMGVLAQVSWAVWLRAFPWAWRCRDISRSASCWASPLSFPITGGGLPHEISKGQ